MRFLRQCDDRLAIVCSPQAEASSGPAPSRHGPAARSRSQPYPSDSPPFAPRRASLPSSRRETPRSTGRGESRTGLRSASRDYHDKREQSMCALTMTHIFDFVYIVQEDLDLGDARQIAFLLYVHVTEQLRKLVLRSERVFEASVVRRDPKSGIRRTAFPRLEDSVAVDAHDRRADHIPNLGVDTRCKVSKARKHADSPSSNVSTCCVSLRESSLACRAARDACSLRDTRSFSRECEVRPSEGRCSPRTVFQSRAGWHHPLLQGIVHEASRRSSLAHARR